MVAIAAWIKMPLCMEVGLGPGDIVLDGDQFPTKRGKQPHFRPMFIVAKRLDRWMDQDATGYGGRHQPNLLYGDSAPPR